jgi:hypothetical protein
MIFQQQSEDPGHDAFFCKLYIPHVPDADLTSSGWIVVAKHQLEASLHTSSVVFPYESLAVHGSPYPWLK